MANDWRYHLRLDMEFDDPEELFGHLRELLTSVDEAQAEHIAENGPEQAERVLSFNGLPDCEHTHGYFGVDVRPVWPDKGRVH